LWGCYSVGDHLERRAFVADLLLYDRLVVPVPAEDDRARWDEFGWQPDRQEILLDVLGDLARRIVWSPSLRDQFDRDWTEQFENEWSPAGVVDDFRGYPMSRVIVSEQLKAEASGHDAKTVRPEPVKPGETLRVRI
jgi:hypothetical protein